MSGNERGVTLIEVLLVLVISSIIAAVAYSILFSSLASTQKSMSDTHLRNEAVFISQQFDKAMLNIDSINDPEDKTVQTKVEVKNKKSMLDDSGTLTEIEYLTVFEIKNKNLEMSSYKDNVLLEKKILNSSSFSLEGTSFKIIESEINSQKEKALDVHFVLSDPSSKQTYTVVKIYGLQSE